MMQENQESNDNHLSTDIFEQQVPVVRISKHMRDFMSRCYPRFPSKIIAHQNSFYMNADDIYKYIFRYIFRTHEVIAVSSKEQQQPDNFLVQPNLILSELFGIDRPINRSKILEIIENHIILTKPRIVN